MYTPRNLLHKTPGSIRHDSARVARELGPCDVITADVDYEAADERVLLFARIAERVLQASLHIAVSCIGVIALVVSGCATTPKGPTDEKALSQATQQMVAAMKAKDITALMTFISEKFASDRFGDKAGVQNLLDMGKGMGFLDNVEIDASGAKTVVTKDRATVTPVSLKGGFGAIVLHFTSAKENGAWKVVSVEGEGGSF